MKRIGFVILFMSAYLQAGVCVPDHCADVFIERLYVESSGTIYVGTSGDESKLNCNAVSGVYVTIPASLGGSSALYSTLLTAQTTNKKISVVQVDDHQAGCIIQYITLDKQ